MAQARTERDTLMRHLTADMGIGGRSRRFTGDAERARLAVGKAIRRALNRLADADPVIGDHLASTVHTGGTCSYRPFAGVPAVTRRQRRAGPEQR